MRQKVAASNSFDSKEIDHSENCNSCFQDLLGTSQEKTCRMSLSKTSNGVSNPFAAKQNFFFPCDQQRRPLAQMASDSPLAKKMDIGEILCRDYLL